MAEPHAELRVSGGRPSSAPAGSRLALAVWTAVNATATSAGLSVEPVVEAAWRLGLFGVVERIVAPLSSREYS